MPKRKVAKKVVKVFDSGAFRDTDRNKLQFSRALSPIVLIRYVEFIRFHNATAAGKRSEDNWKKGFTRKSYMESKFRHFMETWLIQDGLKDYSGSDLSPDPKLLEDTKLEELITSLCAEFFNVQGFLHVLLLEQRERRKSNKLPSPLAEKIKGFSPEQLDDIIRVFAQKPLSERVLEMLGSLKKSKKPIKKRKKITKRKSWCPKTHVAPSKQGSTLCGLGKYSGIKTTTSFRPGAATCKTCEKLVKIWKAVKLLKKANSSTEADRIIKDKKKDAVHYCPGKHQNPICNVSHIFGNIKKTKDRTKTTCKTCKKIINSQYK